MFEKYSLGSLKVVPYTNSDGLVPKYTLRPVQKTKNMVGSDSEHVEIIITALSCL